MPPRKSARSPSSIDQRAVSLDVRKVSGANTVDVADDVKGRWSRSAPILPAGAAGADRRDNSVFIRESVNDVFKELMIGALLTVLVVMLFLNDLKATAITSLALPVSVISAFILMNALGFTLNVLTLMGLSLSIGILIDDAIVVIENIVRHREHGEDHFTRGRQRYARDLPGRDGHHVLHRRGVRAGGLHGRHHRPLLLPVRHDRGLGRAGLALRLVHAHAHAVGVVGRQAARGNGPQSGQARHCAASTDWFDRAGRPLPWHDRLGAAAPQEHAGHRHRGVLCRLMLFPFIGGGFMPESDEGAFNVTFETPEGSSLPYTASRAQAVVAALGALPGVDYTYTTVGAGVTGTVTDGNVFVKLVARQGPSQDQIMLAARAALAPLFGAQISVLRQSGWAVSRASRCR